MKNKATSLFVALGLTFAGVIYGVWPAPAQDAELDPTQPINANPRDRSSLDPANLPPTISESKQPPVPLADVPAAEAEPALVPKRIGKEFRLQTAKADELIAILQHLFDKRVLVAQEVDENVLFVMGPADKMKGVEQLIKKIDTQSRRWTAAGMPGAFQGNIVSGTPIGLPGPASLPFGAPMTGFAPTKPDPALRELNAKYSELDAKVIALAKQHRAAKDDSERDRLRNELRKLTQEQFDARQKAREVELERLRKRLAEVEDSVRKREDLKEKIVDKRVADVLNEPDELQWETPPVAPGTPGFVPQRTIRSERVVNGTRASTSARSLPGPALSPETQTITRYTPRQVTTTVIGPDGKPRIETRTVYEAETVANPLSPFALVPADGPTTKRAEPAYRDAPASRESTSFVPPMDASGVAEAEARLRISKKKLDVFMKRGGLSNIGDTPLRRAELEGEVELAQLQLAQAQKQHEGTKELLELEVQKAQQAYDDAKQDFEETQRVAKKAPGSIPQTQLRKLHGTVEQARIQLERVQTLLRLHIDSGRLPPREEPPVSVDTPDDSDQPQPATPRAR